MLGSNPVEITVNDEVLYFSRESFFYINKDVRNALLSAYDDRGRPDKEMLSSVFPNAKIDCLPDGLLKISINGLIKAGHVKEMTYNSIILMPDRYISFGSEIDKVVKYYVEDSRKRGEKVSRIHLRFI